MLKEVRYSNIEALVCRRKKNSFRKLIVMVKIKLMLYSLLAIWPLLYCSCVTVGIEKASYEVIDKEGKFEVRQYKPQIVAETNGTAVYF